LEPLSAKSLVMATLMSVSSVQEAGSSVSNWQANDGVESLYSAQTELEDVHAVWENDDLFFAYGRNSQDELVIMGRAKNPMKVGMSMEELARIFLDEKLASLEGQDELELWKKERALIMGAFVDLRNSKGSAVAYQLKSSGRKRVNPLSQTLEFESSIIRFWSPPLVADSSRAGLN
jgi:hypothetical protein